MTKYQNTGIFFPVNVLGLSHTFYYLFIFTNWTFILSGAVTQKKFKIEKKIRITFFSQKHVLSDELSSFHFFFIFRSAKNFEKT